MASLNVPSAEGTGDWHMLGTFNEKNTKPLQFIAGQSLISILGRDGIVDRSRDADEYGIQHDGPLCCATHARAIADMVVKSILAGKNASYVTLDDWMPSVADKRQVFDLLRHARIETEFMTKIETWIKKNQ